MVALVQYAAPATEPLTIAEVRRHLALDASDGEPAPGAPAAALAGAGAGNVDNGAHRWLATFATSDGETEAGTPSASVTVGDKSVNGKVVVSGIPLGGSAVTARNLYRTKAGGSIFYYHSTLADNTTTSITDNTADSALGAGAPSTNTTDDPLLALLIASAREAAEAATNAALVTQTLDMYLDAFPYWEMEVIKGPLQQVISITYVDADGATQTLDPARYQVDAADERGRIAPAFGQVWPVTRAQLNAVRVRYVAGYGAAAAVPPDIKAWMLLSIGSVYANRESVNVGNIVNEMPYVDQLVAQNRVHRFF